MTKLIALPLVRRVDVHTWILSCCKPRQQQATFVSPLSVTISHPRTLNFFKLGQFWDKSLSPKSVTSHLPMSSDRSLEHDRDRASTARSDIISHPRRFKYLQQPKNALRLSRFQKCLNFAMQDSLKFCHHEQTMMIRKFSEFWPNKI